MMATLWTDEDCKIWERANARGLVGLRIVESDTTDYRAMLAREKAKGAHAYGIWFVRAELRAGRTYREIVS